jgi:cytochrome-b5 reductase
MEEVRSACWTFRQKALRGEPLFDLVSQLKRESMNMGFRLMFSERFGADLPEDFRTYQFLVEYFFKKLAMGSPSDMMPALRVLPNAFLNDLKDKVRVRDEIIERFVKKHRKEFDALRAQGKMKTRADSRDVCDMLFWDQVEGFDMVDDKGKTVRQFLTDDQITVICFDTIFASTDTTALTNEWAIFHLINNPEVQRKLHEELDRVVGQNRVPNFDDRDSLPYLWAFLKEVFRWCLVAPFAAPHFTINDMTLHDNTGKEYFVPGGTQVFLGAFQLARDPEYWDEPEKFNPDRWLGEREAGLDLYGQVKRKKVEHYKFLPFSLGPRMCPGYSFAKVAQFLQFSTIVHSFRFKMTEGAERKFPQYIKNGQLDLTENWGLSMSPRNYAKMGIISCECRPIARLHKPLGNDIDPTKVFLEGKTEKKIKLLVREQLSHDTALLRFGLGNGNMILGLPIGKHIKVHLPNVIGVEPGKWNGRDDPEAGQTMVTRAYTPTSSDQDAGFVDLLVKIYAPKVNARFPDGGKVSYQLGNLTVGDEISISGPWGLIEYLGESKFKVGRNHVTKRFVGMMAGGSGITPMLQILRAALEDPNDATKFSLIYANQTEKDILCRETLEDLEQRFPLRFRLHYTVDRAPEGGNWKYSVGFIDAAMISEHMPPKSDDTIILGCGPPPMLEFACKKNLEKLGYSKEHWVQF